MLRVIEYAWSTLGALLVPVAAIWLFVFLFLRVRRRTIPKVNAALVYLSTVVLPVIFFFVLWFLANLANSFGASRSIWNGEATLGAIGLAAILLGSMVLLNVTFWVALLFFSKAQPNDPSAT